MGVDIRSITADEVGRYRQAIMTTFGGGDPDEDPHGDERFAALIDGSQAWAAFDGPYIVATAATFMLELVVPGGTLPMAGLTMVTVRPTHRRRGLLRELVGVHLDDARRRGQAVSGLWSSEAPIYGRFGYGVAAEGELVEIDDARSLRVAAGRELDALEWIDEAQALEQLPAIYERATRERPGALRRSETWWRERRFLEAPFVRGGASRRRHALARRGADAVGYLAYRQRGGFTDGLPSGKVEIIELIAVDARAEATLWRLALAIDLFPTVTWGNAPVDHPLPWLVDDRRRVRSRRLDTLWLRLDDVAAALAGRRYAADGALRFAIDDAHTWQLTVADGVGRCAPVAAVPELRLDRSALGSLYLGGVAASQLARAELVRGDAPAIATADRLLRWPVAPWCPEMF
jgi:predicted acetyltransferase